MNNLKKIDGLRVFGIIFLLSFLVSVPFGQDGVLIWTLFILPVSLIIFFFAALPGSHKNINESITESKPQKSVFSNKIGICLLVIIILMMALSVAATMLGVN